MNEWWWCFLLVQQGGKDVFSVTIVGIPKEDWLDQLRHHFGNFVIIDPPIVVEP